MEVGALANTVARIVGPLEQEMPKVAEYVIRGAEFIANEVLPEMPKVPEYLMRGAQAIANDLLPEAAAAGAGVTLAALAGAVGIGVGFLYEGGYRVEQLPDRERAPTRDEALTTLHTLYPDAFAKPASGTLPWQAPPLRPAGPNEHIEQQLAVPGVLITQPQRHSTIRANDGATESTPKAVANRGNSTGSYASRTPPANSNAKGPWNDDRTPASALAQAEARASQAYRHKIPALERTALADIAALSSWYDQKTPQGLEKTLWSHWRNASASVLGATVGLLGLTRMDSPYAGYALAALSLSVTSLLAHSAKSVPLIREAHQLQDAKNQGALREAYIEHIAQAQASKSSALNTWVVALLARLRYEQATLVAVLPALENRLARAQGGDAQQKAKEEIRVLWTTYADSLGQAIDEFHAGVKELAAPPLLPPVAGTSLDDALRKLPAEAQLAMLDKAIRVASQAPADSVVQEVLVGLGAGASQTMESHRQTATALRAKSGQLEKDIEELQSWMLTLGSAQTPKQHQWNSVLGEWRFSSRSLQAARLAWEQLAPATSLKLADHVAKARAALTTRGISLDELPHTVRSLLDSAVGRARP